MTDQQADQAAGPADNSQGDRTPVKAHQTSSDALDVTEAPFTYKTIQAIANTEFVPRGLRGNVPAILACVLSGRELGMGPMESMRRIDMIDGKPSPSAEWMIGQVVAAGHLIYPTEQTATKCTVEGVRMVAGREVARSSFTFTHAMAQRAGLTGKSNWKNYPEAMLYWRAASQLCRQFFPDVLGGLRYLADELGADEWAPEPVSSDDPQLTVVTYQHDDIAEDGEIIDIEPDSEVEEEQWATLLTLLNEAPDEGTMPTIEARVRQMYHLIPACIPATILEPDIDWLHTHLEQHYNVKHVADLKKADLQAFARRAFGWAKQAVTATMKETLQGEETTDE